MTRQIGIATGGRTDQPIVDVLEQIERSGFRAVEIGTPPLHFDPWKRDQVEAVRQCLSRAGVSAVSIHAPFGGALDLSDPNPHHRNAAVGAIVQTALVLKDLGGQVIVVHPTDAPRASEQVPQRLDVCAGALRSLADSCKRIGIKLAIETPLPHLIGGDPSEFGWLLGRLDGNVGACLDTSHTSLGGHWAKFVEVAGPRLIHVHASDNHGAFDDHLPPGDGVIDWREIKESLNRVGFRGWVILEIAWPGGLNDGYLKRAAAAAARLLG